MKINLAGKKILITAGPTWTPIDKIRVLSNIASGKTGISIAAYASEMNASVTLLLGPVQAVIDKKFKKNVRILDFRYFDELFDLVKKETTGGKYDVFIHTAAVSDYQAAKPSSGKIKSNRKELTIRLKPAVKIVDQIKKFDASVFLVKFKLEINKTDAQLINIAYKSMKHSNADLIVANTPDTAGQKTFIIGPAARQIIKIPQRSKLPEYLFRSIASGLKH